LLNQGSFKRAVPFGYKEEEGQNRVQKETFLYLPKREVFAYLFKKYLLKKELSLS